MQSSKITVGMDVAVYPTPSHSLGREELGARTKVERATVEAIVPTGEPSEDGAVWSVRQDRRKRTVKLRVTEALHHSNNGRTLYVEPRHIFATWAEYREARAAHVAWAERAAASRTDKARARARSADELRAFVLSLGLNIESLAIREANPAWAKTDAKISLTLAELHAIIDAAKSR